MEVKSTEWRPGPTVCRCCLSEGCYKDISTEYFWMGKREVYAEMLSETFDVTIGFSKSGGPNSNSRLICEPCISRLRDASEFKRQVLECEKTFMQHLDPGTSTSADLDITVDTDKEVKLERVKTEKRLSDDDFDDRVGFDDDDDDDDDLDDEPLTKLASKVPKKESVDLLDLLDNAKVAEKRKSTAKTKSTPAKKSKKETIQPTPSKSVKIEKKKKDCTKVTVRHNAQIILQYSTAYPFRLPKESMVCVYCMQSYNDPNEFRTHMNEEHRTFKVSIAFAHLPEGDIKVDCTDLRCRICRESFVKLEDVASHLHRVHKKLVDFDFDLGLQPFKLDNGKMICALCSAKFATLRKLSCHTQTHFVRYTCESCGKCFSMLSSLKLHTTYVHINGRTICRKCKLTFATLKERWEHLRVSKLCCMHVCNVCGERFATWNLKQKHMIEAHGKSKKKYPCPECDVVSPSRTAFAVHFKMDHTNDFVECKYCHQKHPTELSLKRHLVTHTGEKLFPCTVCSKSFPRKSNLQQHMWIHSEVKNFECTKCNKQFAQRVSWKMHMKNHHPELCNF